MLASPIYFNKGYGCSIDLSQLAEVGQIFAWPMHDINHNLIFNKNDPSLLVGFEYRYASSANMLRFARPLREGPRRNEDLTLCDPSEHLKTLGEEYFVMDGRQAVSSPSGTPYTIPRYSAIHVHHEKTDQLAVVRNLEAEKTRLINAWKKWKRIEPEIYAIIRKHLQE